MSQHERKCIFQPWHTIQMWFFCFSNIRYLLIEKFSKEKQSFDQYLSKMLGSFLIWQLLRDSPWCSQHVKLLLHMNKKFVLNNMISCALRFCELRLGFFHATVWTRQGSADGEPSRFSGALDFGRLRTLHWRNWSLAGHLRVSDRFQSSVVTFCFEFEKW